MITWILYIIPGIILGIILTFLLITLPKIKSEKVTISSVVNGYATLTFKNKKKTYYIPDEYIKFFHERRGNIVTIELKNNKIIGAYETEQ